MTNKINWDRVKYDNKGTEYSKIDSRERKCYPILTPYGERGHVSVKIHHHRKEGDDLIVRVHGWDREVIIPRLVGLIKDDILIVPYKVARQIGWCPRIRGRYA